MAGENRIDLGEVTQSNMKGKALESALASVLNTPGVQKQPKKAKK